MVTVMFERSRGFRSANERPDGRFSVSVSKVVDVDKGKLFDRWKDASSRAAWLEDIIFLVERRSRKDHSMAFDCSGFASRHAKLASKVEVNFYQKVASKSQVVVQHEGLLSASDVEKARLAWREALARLKGNLEKE